MTLYALTGMQAIDAQLTETLIGHYHFPIIHGPWEAANQNEWRYE